MSLLLSFPSHDPAQVKAAKKRAAAAGRPYPNLVDNAAVKRAANKRKKK